MQEKNAGVIVAIIGVVNKSIGNKVIVSGELHQFVKKINPYLVSGSNSYVVKATKAISKLQEMNFGSMANDGGHLLLTAEEKDKIINADFSALKFIKKIKGSLEFIRGIERYCIWIEESEIENALAIPEIAERVENVRFIRENSKRGATRKLASLPL